MSASEEFVAVIDGIPRTLEELEQLAAAEKAYEQDFPDDTLREWSRGRVEDERGNWRRSDVMALANRHAMIRDYAFTAMGTALMVLVAFLMTHGANRHTDHPSLMAQSIADAGAEGVSEYATPGDAETQLM